MPEEALIVRGAREHNLRDVNVTIPRDKLTVITGLSGSGKSSLAFDTIYAEGQRRYVESLSAYARQFLGLMEKPDVDSIEGLSPAISIEQKTRRAQSALDSRHGHRDLRLSPPVCTLAPERRTARTAARPVERQSAAQIADIVLQWPRRRGSRSSRRSSASGRASSATCSMHARKQGFVRAVVDGDVVELADAAQAQQAA